MIDQLIKHSTCQTVCGEESGTGWIIAKDRVLTARHCVLAAFDENQPIKLIFSVRGHTIENTAQVLATDENTDSCLLAVNFSFEYIPLPVSSEVPREGDNWQSFGYPISRTTIGHRLTGTVSQVLEIPRIKMDIDLAVDPFGVLNEYQGFSGSALVCGGKVVGMLTASGRQAFVLIFIHSTTLLSLPAPIAFQIPTATSVLSIEGNQRYFLIG